MFIRRSPIKSSAHWSKASGRGTPNDIDRLVVWLEGVLATAQDIAPTAHNIESRLGAGSSAYALDRATPDEADYLCAVINAPVTTELVRPFMSYGKDERDIHKHIWEVPIPLFDEANPVHRRLAELAKAVEQTAAQFAYRASFRSKPPTHQGSLDGDGSGPRDQ
jgi:hypothetical protein